MARQEQGRGAAAGPGAQEAPCPALNCAALALKYLECYLNGANPLGGREEAEADWISANDPNQLFDRLAEVRDWLAGRLAQPGMLEPEWSMADRRLVGQIQAVLDGFKQRAKTMLEQPVIPTEGG